jgi:acetyl-CoA synthetase
MREVQKAANALMELGVTKGDRVAIYMPMIPELPIAMLACARIGAPHTVVFGGFSAEALRGRINDCRREAVITADGGWRRGKASPSSRTSTRRWPTRRRSSTSSWSPLRRRAPTHGPTAATSGGTTSSTGRPRLPAVPVDREHMLYLLYTSGTTAKPKGIMHTTAGYLLGRVHPRDVFDLKPDDVYWCAADIGWVTGHSYIVYGPLANATTASCTRAARHAGWDRWWQIIEEYKVTSCTARRPRSARS